MQSVYDESGPFEELARAIIRVSFVLRQDLETVFDELTDVPRELVRIVVRTPGLTVAELALRTGKQRSNTSSAVAELEHQGFVSRRPHETDKRSIRIHPTAKAQEEIRRIYRHWAKELRTWSAGLNPVEQDLLLAAIPTLRPLTDAAEQAQHDTLPPPSPSA